MKFWQSRYNPQCKLSQQDLRDISEDITQAYAPHETHHQPELVLMPVDPINLYAYWNLKENETDNEIKHIDKQLALRVYSIPELSEHSSQLQLSFDINVSGFRNQLKVHLPVAATAYSAVIGEINADNSFSALAISDTIHVPRENPVSENSNNDNGNTLAINQALENNFVMPFTTQASPVLEHNLNDSNTVQTSQTQEDKFIPEMSTQSAQPSAIILKNFNDYGYDLKVYENESSPEFKSFLSKQDLIKQLNTKKSNTVDKKTSGQGCIL